MLIRKERLDLIKQDAIDVLDDLFGVLYIYRKLRGGVWTKYKDSIFFKGEITSYFQWTNNPHVVPFSFLNFFYREIIKREDHIKNENT